ncbi:hypothetical protein C4561_01165 [candidate division WWE3 bacterium]|uniref:LemA family protein n=1 Tax=candidate division WWE3 bacterium TaxID=2053526 RepID=A0A3A4ZFU4_UNCKA|nr:MAG: hypothetical protein C4561_01165 [candidate division WWE3 bacterium]
MKNKRSLMFAMIFILMASAFLPACAAKKVAVEGSKEYNELIALWQGAQYGASNFNLVVDTQYGKIQATTQQANSYYESVITSGEVWTGQFREQGEALADLIRNYKDENGQPLDPSQLNLNDLQQQGALPDGLAAGFALYVNAIQQAPPPVPDSAVTLSLMDTTSEAMNTIQLAGTDWNDAVRKYNTRRSQIRGEVVAAVSNFLGYPLPESLPFYAGGNQGQPVENPLAP